LNAVAIRSSAASVRGSGGNGAAGRVALGPPPLHPAASSAAATNASAHRRSPGAAVTAGPAGRRRLRLLSITTF
jgi:hypothetical protein